ncbi:MAG: hypothetical protein H6Q99_848 [Proteobacteria bacterium]|nr:hypothetical protein [Pseudomonadota bacterium]
MDAVLVAGGRAGYRRPVKCYNVVVFSNEPSHDVMWRTVVNVISICF